MLKKVAIPTTTKYDQSTVDSNSKQKQSLLSTQTRGTAAYYVKTRKEIASNHQPSEKHIIDLDDYEEVSTISHSITTEIQLHGTDKSHKV